MAQVKTLSNNSCFFENDACLAELISLEITEDNSPKNDFNFYSLLQSDAVKEEMKSENSTMSLGILARNHLENDKILNDWYFEGDFCLSDIVLDSDSSNIDNSDMKSLGILSGNHLKIDKTLNAYRFDGDCNPIDLVGDELVPDIDLSLCITKNTEDKFYGDTLSSSPDSGFDETDSSSTESTSSPLEKTTLNTDGCVFNKVRQSLLSRAISAKPKIDCQRLAKIKKIRSELLKHYTVSTKPSI